MLGIAVALTWTAVVVNNGCPVLMVVGSAVDLRMIEIEVE